MIKYLDCGKCTNEQHSSWNCNKIGHCWTDAFGRLPYSIRMFNKNYSAERMFWESI